MIKSEIMLKYAIMANGVCLGALPVKDDSSEMFWNGSELQGGHCIAIVGWNEDGFILRNSWGKAYGENGYGCIPYEDFNKFYEVWTIL